MLTRAARRRQTLRYIQHAVDQIQLPWLCPAISHSHTTSAVPAHRPIARRNSTPRPKPSALLSTHARKLASAAPLPDQFEVDSNGYGHFPYRDHLASESQRKLAPSSLSHLDLSEILMIDQTTALPPERLDTNRKLNFDVRGNALEIEATLDACLQIRQWDRANSILGQLKILYQANPQKLLRPYNRMFEAMVYDYLWNKSTENERIINRWIEKYMKEAGVQPDAQTFALKIKAALWTLEGKKRDRTVRRYWEMAKDYHVDWEVVSLRDILSDSDLGKLSEINLIDLGIQTEQGEPEVQGIEIAADDEMVSSPAAVSIREMDQKGLGMTSLRQSLSLFSESRHLDEWHNIEDADETTRKAYAQQRQARLERDSLQSAVDRWKIENEKMVKMGITGNITSGKLGALLWQWHESLEAKIIEEIRKVDDAEAKAKKTPEDRLRCEYGPFLRLIEPDRLAGLCTISIMQILSKAGVNNSHKLARVVTDMGRRVEAEVEAQLANQKKEERSAKNKKLGSAKKENCNSAGQKALETSASQNAEELSRYHSRRRHWTAAIHGKVGAILCELLFDCAKITSRRSSDGLTSTTTQSAFDRQTIYDKGKRIGVLTVQQDLAEMMVHEPVADLIAKQLPMISEPRPWTAFREGGFLESRQDVMRIKFFDQAQRDYGEAAAERGDLDQMFAGLDVLGRTGWRINKEVFSVMLDAWNSGEEIANLPPLNKEFPEVPKPAADADLREKYAWHQRMKQINNEKGGLHSNRCFQNFQMEIAKAYQDETFYLPHNVDFRGRAYPMPPYLNQMGADNARGLLLFEKGKALGPSGLKWLKVHLANVYGYDKASLSDRAEFALEHMEDIRDSVQNPLHGKKWWLGAEDPWQCLAACHELTKAIDSGDPESFISCLPIHQDGTCNGLQHYAALGGDIAGARQVNLEPGDKPADVYTGVAELVKADIKEDAAAGVEIAQLLDGKIKRKIVKQTVMTNVYGVTFAGAMRQVRRQLDDLVPELNEQGKAGPASVYIARKIFKGLGTLFEGAHDIQYWFGDCANRITRSISPAQLEEFAQKEADNSHGLRLSKDRTHTLLRRKNSRTLQNVIDESSFRSTVIWTTPLKLPVVQPYRISQAQQMKTHLASISLMEPNIADRVDRRKQLQGFPPNFIHSLDATHMLLSALKANELGVTFSAVHDSFWAHAADIDSLNRLLRDAFIRMHSEDIVGRLAAEFKKRYHGHLYLARISSTSKLARAIKEYRDSQNTTVESKAPIKRKTPTGMRSDRDRTKHKKYQELLKEHKRQQLLGSSDLKEREEGRNMVTAASLFEQFNGEQYLSSKNSLGETALGKLPDADPEALEEALKHEDEHESHDVDLHSTLDPLLGNEETKSAENAQEHQATSERSRSPSRTGVKKPSRNATVWLWLPLTFKPVPKKGDWDVERLRNSTYFFS